MSRRGAMRPQGQLRRVSARFPWLQVTLSYVSFVALGMPASILGVAWPSAMQSFGRSLDDVGAILVALTVGSILSGFASGPLMARVGAGAYLTSSCGVAALGALGFALSGVWPIVVAAGFLVGLSAGGIDSALNLHFAENYDSRLMNWLHACFGLGATLGPLLMTLLLAIGRSWRWGYAIVGGAEVVLALCFALTAGMWRRPSRSGQMPAGPGLRDVGMGASLRVPMIVLGLSVFLFAAGVESIAGQWPYSLFTEARGVGTTTAGLWMAVYWGALTASRVLFGLLGSRVGANSLLRTGMIAVVVGSVLLTIRSPELIGFLGLALAGFAMAPVIPLLQLVTPRRVGGEHTANAIGLQTAAGYLGVGVLPSLAGYVAEQAGLETIGLCMIVGSLAMVALHEVILRRASARQVSRDN